MNKHVLPALQSKLNTNIGCELWEFHRAAELEDRRLYLYGEIAPLDEDGSFYSDTSVSSYITEQIINYNRIDDGTKPSEREPIRLYINSPGGDVTEGFAIVSAIELSKTPVYTINLGEWCSMAFLIGITGKRRFSLPYSTFMMHEPSTLVSGKFSDIENVVNFNKKFSNKIIKELVCKYGDISSSKYTRLSKNDYYMLPEDALKLGFIDEIVTDIEAIF